MGYRILSDRENSLACFYCSTTDVAFGPVFCDQGIRDADERAEAFLRWLKIDPRRLDDAELSSRYGAWLAQEADQWQREDAPPTCRCGHEESAHMRGHGPDGDWCAEPGCDCRDWHDALDAR